MRSAARARVDCIEMTCIAHRRHARGAGARGGGHGDRQHEFADAARHPDDRGRGRARLRRPGGLHHAVHALRLHEPGDARRHARAADRRGARRDDARAGRAPGREAHLRFLRLERGHDERRAGARHARVHQGRVRERPDRAPPRPAAALEQHDLVELRRRAVRLRKRDVAVGRHHGRRQPRLSRRGLAGGRAHRVVREADRRRRDAADDGRGPAADRGQRRRARARRHRRRSIPAGITSARRTRSRATRPPSTSRCSRPGRTSRPGRKSGSLDTAQRANAIWKQLLAEYQRPPMDPAVEEALNDYVARRKLEIDGHA